MSVCLCVHGFMGIYMHFIHASVSLQCVVGSTDIHSQLEEILEGILSSLSAAGLNQLNSI